MQSKTVTLRFSDAENGLTLEACLEKLLRHLPYETTQEYAVCSKTTR